MQFVWTREAQTRFEQRLSQHLTKEQIELIIRSPESQIVEGSTPNKPDLFVFQQLSGSGIVRVVVDTSAAPWKLVTVYYAKPSSRYWNINVVSDGDQEKVCISSAS